MATSTKILLLDASSPVMEQMIFFHDHTLMILVIITSLVGYTMLSLMFNNFTNRTLLEGQDIEILWTILPAFTLIFIALPSLRILYLTDEIFFSSLTLKTIGHQWYWSYEYSNFKNVEFDSYMMPYESGDCFRLLDVDSRTSIPINIYTRVLITAADVIHSWTVPSLAVKADAIPGRLNQSSFLIKNPGLFFGQCSEICGANHSFMPIVIEACNLSSFKKWILSF
uniref:Cytochrome c oxidase subunit 2 n=1 Tax=Scutigerella causeyae TaxID=388540 RepID=Q06RG4_9MYRI|nr:cytochrome c oxidase subunit II [Scutigerella causeyae]ABF93302.1 cytochrome c oxidase subunit II [Scutigerella causeyae]